MLPGETGGVGTDLAMEGGNFWSPTIVGNDEGLKQKTKLADYGPTNRHLGEKHLEFTICLLVRPEAGHERKQ